MLKLLVVDDERLVRELICMCVDWEEIGFTIVGTASTAEEGIEKVKELQPDVIFTDVRMPGQTGLDLARAVVENYPLIKVVVISGYEEFSYVSEGLKIGIFDYLLKPISEEDLTAVGCRVRDAILEERQHNEAYEYYKKEFEENYEKLKERTLARLVYSPEVELVEENLKLFKIELKPHIFQTALVEYGLEDEFESEADLMKFIQIRDIVNHFFEPYGNIFIFESRYRHIGIINNQEEGIFEELCGILCRILAEQIPGRICIGVGSFYHDIRQTSISYREAGKALQYGFAKKSGECVYYRDILKTLDSEEKIRDSIINNYSYYIGQGMIEEAKELLSETYENLANQDFTKEQAMFLTLNLMMETYSTGKKLNIDMENLDKDRTQVLSGVLKMTSLSDMEKSLSGLLDTLFDAFRERNGKKGTNIIVIIEEYVKAHYQEPDISLAGLAEKFYLNPNYLCRIFKQKTNKTFREYLLDLRMEQAILLLRQTTLKSYEVAEKVGIQDPNYFSTCFKKKFGYGVHEMDRRGR